MTDFATAWGQADPDAAGNGDDLDPPADGTYDVGLVDAGAFVSKKGDPFVKMKWQVVSTQAQGAEWTVLSGFKSQGQANVTKATCRDVGVNVDQVTGLEALDEALKAKTGGYFTVTVKTNGQFRNTYIDGPYTGTASVSDLPAPDISDVVAAAQASGAATDDSDIPF